MDDADHKYSFDTSAFINTWAVHYRPNSFSGLWKKLEESAHRGLIYATEEVLEEIKRQDDDLLRWCLSHQKIFVPHNDPIQVSAREVLRKYKKLIDSRTNRHGADPFVIALARVMNLTVVTYEGGSGSDNKPNIPYVCKALTVRCVRFADFIEEQGWVF